VQGDVPVGVAGQVEDAPAPPAGVDDVALVHQVGGDGELDRGADLGPRRRRSQVGRHAVIEQVALVLGVVALLPAGHRQGPVEPALDDLSGSREPGEPGARPEVVGVVVGEHEPGHRRVAEGLKDVLPPRQGQGSAEAGVDERPPVRRRQRVAVDVVERPGQRHRHLDDAGLELGDDRLRHGAEVCRDSPGDSPRCPLVVVVPGLRRHPVRVPVRRA